MKRLCAAGADVESEKTHGGRAIHTAADTNQPEVITALLECGARRNALLMDDTTALYLAAQNGFTEVARALVEHKCESDFCLAQKEAAALDFEMPTGPASSQVLPPYNLYASDTHRFHIQIAHTYVAFPLDGADINEDGRGLWICQIIL